MFASGNAGGFPQRMDAWTLLRPRRAHSASVKDIIPIHLWVGCLPGRFVAFQMAKSKDDAGVGYGIFVLDLERGKTQPPR